MFRSATPRKASLSATGRDKKLLYSRWKLVDFDFKLVDTFAIELTERNDHRTLLWRSTEDFKVLIMLRKLNLDFEIRLQRVNIKDNVVSNHARASQSVSDLAYLVKTIRVIVEPETVCRNFLDIKTIIVDKRSPECQSSDTDLKSEVIIGFVEISLHQQSLFTFCKWLEKVFRLESSLKQAVALKGKENAQNRPGFFPLWLQNSLLGTHNVSIQARFSNLKVRLVQQRQAF